MTDDLLKDGPRNPDPHGGVDDPGDKPPASDPQIRKGPLVDPPTKEPAAEDPPAKPHVPGDPVPELKDPPASGILQDGVSIQDPNFV